MNKSYRKILSVVSLIPPSYVASYGQVADLAGLPRGARMVSKALKANRDNSVPWHRVVNSQGKISIPVGEPSHRLQLSLLREEGVELKGSKVNLAKHQWQPSLDTLLFELSF
ncbi:MGMT family protein [Psychrobium sp. MM17-31]|uniref:MGMT family protein n=1 Tax=Psychrobium sp. MM17-31 TaxID=2917758 RepID=UPI001EF68CC6|nr:MGMT family protein [Psychrobium sp. MM17-31]MCG7531024.1 MGMT family protein [Psychrobium sp. MM17-31]